MTDVMRPRRRTSLVTIGPDTVELCEPECRNEVLLDLGVPASGGWAYPAHGQATVTVAWNGKTYHVEWHRRRVAARPCDLCWDEWRYRIPRLVATARARSEAMADDPRSRRICGRTRPNRAGSVSQVGTGPQARRIERTAWTLTTGHGPPDRADPGAVAALRALRHPRRTARKESLGMAEM